MQQYKTKVIVNITFFIFHIAYVSPLIQNMVHDIKVLQKQTRQTYQELGIFDLQAPL